MKRFITIILFLAAACEVEDPVKEDTPELVTEVHLAFLSPSHEPVSARAVDPDGEGVADLEITQPIILKPDVTYTLEISLINGLAEPLDPAYDITEEVREEADEHLFLFSWTGPVFTEPTGDGNIDRREDNILYKDSDSNGLPLGLQTQWQTASSGTGTVRIVLKHQPDIKSEVSGFEQGETDLDITFPVDIR